MSTTDLLLTTEFFGAYFPTDLLRNLIIRGNAAVDCGEIVDKVKTYPQNPVKGIFARVYSGDYQHIFPSRKKEKRLTSFSVKSILRIVFLKLEIQQ